MLLITYWRSLYFLRLEYLWFSHSYAQSKVDLMDVLIGQDKWRNLHAMASGRGSRQPGRTGCKSIQPTVKHVDSALHVSTVFENGIEVLDAKSLAASYENVEDVGSKEAISRLLCYPFLELFHILNLDPSKWS